MKPCLTDKFLILECGPDLVAIYKDDIRSVSLENYDTGRKWWKLKRAWGEELEAPQTEANNRAIAEFLGCDLMDYEGGSK